MHAKTANFLQIFLENNGRVDVFDHEGRSALHLAAEFGSIEVCEALLNKNAFINSKAKTGWTSLHYAAMQGFTALVEYLIKKHNATIDSLTMVIDFKSHFSTYYSFLKHSLKVIKGDRFCQIWPPCLKLK